MCESFQIVLAIPRCGAGSDSVSLRHTSFPSTITYYLIFTTNFGIPCVLSAVNVEMFIVYRLILTSEPRRTMWNGSNRRGGSRPVLSHHRTYGSVCYRVRPDARSTLSFRGSSFPFPSSSPPPMRLPLGFRPYPPRMLVSSSYSRDCTVSVFIGTREGPADLPFFWIRPFGRGRSPYYGRANYVREADS